MIVFVDLEHKKLWANPDRAQVSLSGRLMTKYRLEEISGEPCLIVRYEKASPEFFRSLGVRAVVVSGNATEFDEYVEADLAGLRRVFIGGEWPLLAFCGSHQLMAQTYGAQIGPMGRLANATSAQSSNGPTRPASDLAGWLPQDMKRESGFTPVKVEVAHPVFAGLPETSALFESHYWEVKDVPKGFRVIASNAACRIQAMAHESLPIVGTQFHPERWDQRNAAGRRVIENFFRMAKLVR